MLLRVGQAVRPQILLAREAMDIAHHVDVVPSWHLGRGSHGSHGAKVGGTPSYHPLRDFP